MNRVASSLELKRGKEQDKTKYQKEQDNNNK